MDAGEHREKTLILAVLQTRLLRLPKNHNICRSLKLQNRII